MKVKLDEKHFFNSDAYCYWITCLVTSTNKKTGEEKTVERRVSGYARAFSDAVNSFIENKIRTSEAEDLDQLKREVQELKKEVRAWKVNLTEGAND